MDQQRSVWIGVVLVVIVVALALVFDQGCAREPDDGPDDGRNGASESETIQPDGGDGGNDGDDGVEGASAPPVMRLPVIHLSLKLTDALPQAATIIDEHGDHAAMEGVTLIESTAAMAEDDPAPAYDAITGLARTLSKAEEEHGQTVVGAGVNEPTDVAQVWLVDFDYLGAGRTAQRRVVYLVGKDGDSWEWRSPESVAVAPFEYPGRLLDVVPWDEAVTWAADGDTLVVSHGDERNRLAAGETMKLPRREASVPVQLGRHPVVPADAEPPYSIAPVWEDLGEVKFTTEPTLTWLGTLEVRE